MIARSISGVLIGAARFWQRWPSVMLPPSSRFAPSGSAYAGEAWTRYGPLTGTVLAARRILRCHPWGGSGCDPVP